MQLLDCIETQLISNRLPLVGVSVAAVPHANTPVVLTLHWHGFVETKLADVTDANVVAYQPVPSSALQVNDRWDRLEDLEHAILEADDGMHGDFQRFMFPFVAHEQEMRVDIAYDTDDGAVEAPYRGAKRNAAGVVGI